MLPFPLPVAVVVGAAALLSWLILALLIPLLRRSILDSPNARSAHRVPTPRGGGIAFVAVSGGWGAPLLPLLCTPLALLGLIDDRFDLPAWLRFAVQFLTAVVLLLFASLPLPAAWWAPLDLLLRLVTIVAAINFMNFTDGLDGLVGSCAAVMFTVAAISLSADWLWPLVGALLGFLLWNWSPAKVFMGDVGSTFLGALYAAVVLQEPTSLRALGLLAVGFPLFGDACVCVIRRLVAGQPVFQAHRLHLFQRLQQAGWSHAWVTVLYTGLSVLLGLVFLLRGAVAELALLLPISGGAIWIDQNVAVPFQRPR